MNDLSTVQQEIQQQRAMLPDWRDEGAPRRRNAIITRMRTLDQLGGSLHAQDQILRRAAGRLESVVAELAAIRGRRSALQAKLQSAQREVLAERRIVEGDLLARRIAAVNEQVRALEVDEARMTAQVEARRREHVAAEERVATTLRDWESMKNAG
jgi:hypothetical protein